MVIADVAKGIEPDTLYTMTEVIQMERDKKDGSLEDTIRPNLQEYSFEE